MPTDSRDWLRGARRFHPEGITGPCSTCQETGRKGYCAGARCYCGHEACPAYPSYIDPFQPDRRMPDGTVRSSLTYEERQAMFPDGAAPAANQAAPSTNPDALTWAEKATKGLL